MRGSAGDGLRLFGRFAFSLSQIDDDSLCQAILRAHAVLAPEKLQKSQDESQETRRFLRRRLRSIHGPAVAPEGCGDADGAAQVVIGETLDERLLFVVHIMRNDEVIRIVSARPVTSHERREYEE